MNMIRKYLRLRKQYDSVKLITILFIALIVFIVLSVFEIYGFYKDMNTKTEYVLISSDNIEKIKLKLTKIEEMDGNIAAGIEKDYTITFDDGETSVLVKEMSQEYLNKCYGLNDNIFYLNSSAFELAKATQNQLTLHYQKEDENLSGVFKLQANLNDSTPFALKRGDFSSLYAKSDLITVSAMFDSADVSGETSKSLQSLGFEIENKVDIEQQKYDRNLFFIKIKYNVFIILFILLFITVMIKNTTLQLKNYNH